MSYCPKCGTQIVQDTRFCPSCGTEVKGIKSWRDSTGGQLSDMNRTIRIDNPAYGTVDLNNLPLGHLIERRYEIKQKIGQGGFGAVYQAFDKKMNVDKALKIIPEAITNDLRAMQNLRDEAQTMIQLNHPNIVRFYDFHDEGTIKYIDMEYIEGKTLNELLLDYPSQRMPEAKVKEIALKIIEGMIYAHSKGIIHRDIKPQNIMLSSDEQVKIMDFGIAETLRNSMSRLQPTSSSGTLTYMSPEQIRGGEVGRESDIYSFGATLYELLSGNPPFYKGDITYQILNELVKGIDEVSNEMNVFLEKCLSKKVEDRYSKFIDVKRKLNSIDKEPKPPIAELRIGEASSQKERTKQILGDYNEFDGMLSNQNPKHSIAFIFLLILIFSILVTGIVFSLLHTGNKEGIVNKDQVNGATVMTNTNKNKLLSKPQYDALTKHVDNWPVLRLTSPIDVRIEPNGLTYFSFNKNLEVNLLGINNGECLIEMTVMLDTKELKNGFLTKGETILDLAGEKIGIVQRDIRIEKFIFNNPAQYYDANNSVILRGYIRNTNIRSSDVRVKHFQLSRLQHNQIIIPWTREVRLPGVIAGRQNTSASNETEVNNRNPRKDSVQESDSYKHSVTNEPSKIPKGKYMEVTSALSYSPLLDSPDLTSNQLYLIPPTSAVYVLAVPTSKFLYVWCDGHIGYLFSSFANTKKSASGYKLFPLETFANPPVMATPEPGSEVILDIPTGYHAYLLDIYLHGSNSKNFYRVWCDGKFGYLSGAWLINHE